MPINDNWHVHPGRDCCPAAVTATWPLPMVQQGWECPKCGRVYSPSMVMCTYCPQQPVTTTGTGTSETTP